MTHKNILRIITSLMLMVSFSQAAVLAEFRGSKGNADKALSAMVKKFDAIGISIIGKNEHIELHYLNTFKEKNLDILNFYTITDKTIMRDLLIKNPDFGAYTPFNLLGYKHLEGAPNSDVTWYGHLDVETMLQIIGEKDETLKQTFRDMVSKVDDLVEREMKPTLTNKMEFDKELPKQPLLKMVKKFEGVEDIESYVEDFIMKHDSAFTKHHFVVAGFLDMKFEYADMELDFDEYDAYWVSSLCHFQFSNSVFNHDAPHAGVFAPCSIYFYIPQGKNELHVGYATVENWLTSTNIKDPAQLAYMKEVADEVVEVFRELGFTLEEGTGGESAKALKSTRELSNEIDELKAMIKALAKDVAELKKKEPIKSEPVKSVSPQAVILPKKEFKTAKMVIGGNAPKNLTAYYAANPQSIDALKEKLTLNGFEILGTNEILKGKTVITITNDELKKTNTFMAALNILVNEGDEVRVQNPSYFGAAYLQDKFTYGQFKATLTSLQAVLGDMYIVSDVNEFSKLENYNFMFGMPHFEDTIEVGNGSHLSDKLTGEKADKHIAYSLKLPNGDILVGHKMRTRNNKFLLNVDASKNAHLLPYQSIIRDTKAVMLDPKFYLALSLPLLTMTDFMKIASAPDEIEKELVKAYK